MPIALLLALAPIQAAPAQAAVPAQAPTPADNPAMTRLFEADQAARKGGPATDWRKVAADDAQRRAETRKLLDSGALQTGTDYWRAAFLFQHGGKPEDYLLAHSLAIAAAAKGNGKAPWIAAASLDRYLHAIGKPQVYGTQFSMPNNAPTTQEPYDRTVLSDALRATAGVPPLAEQEKQRAEWDREMAAEAKANPSPH